MKSSVSARSYSIEDFQDQVADWLWGTDPCGVLVYSNKRLDAFSRPDKGTYLGQDFMGIFRNLLPDLNCDRERPLETLKRLTGNQREFSNIVIRFMSQCGKPIRLILDGRPKFDERGVFDGYRGVGRIDDSPLISNKGGANLETLMIAVENSPNGVVITDENGVIQYANPGSRDITGYSREECYGQTPRLFRSGHTSLSVYSNFWNTLLQGKTWRGTVYNKHKNGEYFWCREVVSPIVHEDGTISNFVAVQEDVTFRLIAEEQLEKAEERFKGFAEAATDWYWETDSKFSISYISDAKQDFMGSKLEELFQAVLSEGRQGAIDVKKVAGLLDPLMNRTSFKNIDYRFTRDNGDKCHWRLSGEACFSTDGDFTGYRGVGKDVTSRSELEEELQQSRKMEEVGQRAGGLAHDFNNLLAIIMGNAELLKEQLAKTGKEEDSYLENILYATKRGMNISNQLLVFSRKQSLNPKKVILDHQLKQMMEILKSSVGPDIDILVDAPQNLWPSYVDADYLVNSILNLSINSRDAMDRKGEIRISLHNQSIDQELSAKDISKGDYVVITVEDNGEGISKENLQKVYEPFYSSKGPGKGTGLGLSMVYGFAKKSGGAIWIESEKDKGTCVHLYLPRFRPAMSGENSKSITARY